MKNLNKTIYSDITLDSIAEHCKNDFKINKTTFAGEIFVADGWMSRIRRKKAKMNDYHYQQLFKLLHNYCSKFSMDFVSTMQEWYPSLKDYHSENEIINVIHLALERNGSNDDQSDDISSHTFNQFIDSCLTHKSPIKSLKLTAHSGYGWLYYNYRFDFLNHVIQNNGTIQIISNPNSAVKDISITMEHPANTLRYLGFDNNLKKWHDFELKTPNINLRISDLPMLRHLVLVEFEDGSAKCHVRDYIYNHHFDIQYPYKQYSNQDREFAYYKEEFNFLWEKGTTYEKWYNSLPKKEETLDPDEYVLIHPINDIPNNSMKFEYHSLYIQNENTVSLKTNGFNIDNLESMHVVNSYTGELKVTRNNLFISAYDKDEQEEISMSLVRPVQAKERFIGLITRLNPSGNPVVLKCACIKRDIFSKIDQDLLFTILTGNNQQNQFLLKEKDINLFYSNQIFLTD